MKKDENVVYHCYQAVDDDALDELIRDLTETALASGGFVAFFGPDDEGDGGGAGGAEPPGHRRARGPTVLPRCPDPDWWSPST